MPAQTQQLQAGEHPNLPEQPQHPVNPNQLMHPRPTGSPEAGESSPIHIPHELSAPSAPRHVSGTIAAH